MLASKKRPRPQQLDLAPAAESAPLTKCGEWRGDQGDGAGPPKPRKRLCSPSFLTPTLSRLAGSASGMTMSPSGGHSFFDLDLLESGVAREVVHPNVLAPLEQQSSWTYSYIKKLKVEQGDPCKRKFCIYRESDDAFLLAACEYQGLYFISQHKKFPLAFDPTKTLNDQYLEGRYVALLRPKGKRAGRFELVTFACENCDTRLGKYSCGTFTMDPARQVLAEIEQKVVKLQGPGNLSARRVTVSIPRTHDNGTRAVWCPRCPRKSGLGISLPSTLPVAPQTPSAPESGSYASLRTDSFMSTMSGPAVAAMSGSMQAPPLPRPSAQRSDTRSDDESSAGGFSLSDDDDVGAGGGTAAGAGAGAGAGSRPTAGSSSPVLTHSMASRRSAQAMRPPPVPGMHRRTKSMPGSLKSPVAAEPDLTNDTEVIVSQVPEWNKAEGSLVMEFIGDRISDPSTKNYLLASAERSKDVLQFGRQSKHKFAFDVRHPLSVLQGFGIFLSAFVWSVDQVSVE